MKDLVEQYLTNEEVLKTIQYEQDRIKTQLWEDLEAGQRDPGTKWGYDGVGTVCLVKGRAGRKTLNRAKLVQQGVTAEQLEAATDTAPDGMPHLRIERPKG